MYRHIFDRSNLDEVIAYGPNGPITRRKDLQTGMIPRTDIVLLNGTRSGDEYSLHVRMEGFAGDVWILNILTDDEYDRVQKIADRMRKNALVFSPAWKLL